MKLPMKLLGKVFAAILIAGLVVAVGFYFLIFLVFSDNGARQKISHPDNVYEKIWNDVRYEITGKDTTLEKMGDDYFFVRFEQGCFESISINHTILLTYDDDYVNKKRIDYLKIYLTVDSDKTQYIYMYDIKNNILYGEAEEELLLENFVNEYLETKGDKSKYSTGGKGDYTFILSNSIWDKML